VVVPHRGPRRDLEVALAMLSRTAGPADRVRVGLDLEDPAEYLELVAAHPGVELYVPERPPVGPDSIRQALIEMGTERLIAFQDSDDLPCRDRLAALRA